MPGPQARRQKRPGPEPLALETRWLAVRRPRGQPLALAQAEGEGDVGRGCIIFGPRGSLSFAEPFVENLCLGGAEVGWDGEGERDGARRVLERWFFSRLRRVPTAVFDVGQVPTMVFWKVVHLCRRFHSGLFRTDFAPRVRVQHKAVEVM